MHLQRTFSSLDYSIGCIKQRLSQDAAMLEDALLIPFTNNSHGVD